MAYEDYWTSRADARMEDIQSGSDETLQNIFKAYDSAIDQLNRDIDRLFWRFAGRSGLTEEEAAALLQEKVSGTALKNMRSRMETILDEGIKAELQKKLEATAYRARITRLEAIKEDIYIQTSRMADAELRMSTARYFDIVREEYLHNVFDCQQYLGYAYSFSKIPANTIKEILRDDWSGRHYSKRIWDNSVVNGGRIEDTVKQLLLRGTLTGMNSRRMATALHKVTNAGKYACERLIRTETTYFVAMADLEAAKRRGTKQVQFVATLDNRTSEQCREHDGKIIDIEKAVPGKTIPPLHPFCRSVIIDVIEGLVHKVRTARDPKTGKNYKVPADMTYSDWKELVDARKIMEPEIVNQMMQDAAKEFRELLEKNDDGSNLFRMMKLNAENVTYKEDFGMRNAYAYDPNTDEFKYNSRNAAFSDYDMNFVYAHELAHRLDVTWTHSWENDNFLRAIDNTRKSLYNNQKKVLSWLDGKYQNNAALSDIISALSRGTLEVPYMHNEEYWNSSPLTVPLEIFAELVSMKIVTPSLTAELDGFLDELFKALEEMV
ncbi:MAG: minor capsid protein [Roseburia sp.]|nr:minor capsid protein [Roseburia sp.]